MRKTSAFTFSWIMKHAPSVELRRIHILWKNEAFTIGGRMMHSPSVEEGSIHILWKDESYTYCLRMQHSDFWGRMQQIIFLRTDGSTSLVWKHEESVFLWKNAAFSFLLKNDVFSFLRKNEASSFLRKNVIIHLSAGECARPALCGRMKHSAFCWRTRHPHCRCWSRTKLRLGSITTESRSKQWNQWTLIHLELFTMVPWRIMTEHCTGIISLMISENMTQM